MKNNKFGIPVIIVLLIICVPAAIYGVFYGSVLEKEAGNPKHERIFDGKVYYYDSANNLLGYYVCTSGTCNYPRTTVDDDKDFGYEFTGTEIGVLGSIGVVQDGSVIKLINLKGTEPSTDIMEVKSLKDYDGRLNAVIVGDANGKFGLIDKASGSVMLSYEYDFIGANSEYSMAKFITMQSGAYTITGADGNNTLQPSTVIIDDFDDNAIYYKDGDSYIIRDASATNIFKDYVIKRYQKNDLMFVAETDKGIIIYDRELKNLMKSFEGANLTFKLDDTLVEVFDNNEKTGEYSYEG